MYSRFVYLLYQILGIYIFYFSLFNNLIYIAILGGILKITQLLLMVVCLFHRRKAIYPNNANRLTLILFYVYLTIVGIMSIPFSTSDGFKLLLQFYYFPLYVYVFLNFRSLTKRSYYEYFGYLVKVACVFVITNIFLYFYELPIWFTYQPWFGRITNGYPTTDVVCLCYAFLIVCFVERISINNVERTVYTVLLLIGIITQFSGTGMVISITIIGAFLFCLFKEKSVSLKRNIERSIIVVLIIASSGYGLLYSQEPQLANKAMSVITTKIGYFIGGSHIQTEWDGVSYNDDTMEIRDDQYEKCKDRYLKSPLNYLFGVSFKNATIDGDKRHDTQNIFIEHQFGFNLVTIGYLGYILFLLFICSPLHKWIVYYKSKDVFILVMGILSVLIFIFSSKTTITLISPQIEIVFAMFYSILLFPMCFSNISRNSNITVSKIKK